MEAFFDIMKTKSQLKDGYQKLCSTHSHLIGAESHKRNGSFLSSSSEAPDYCVGTFEGGLAVELKDVHFGYSEGREVPSSAATDASFLSRFASRLVSLLNCLPKLPRRLQILRGVSIKVEPGKSVAIVGPSGCVAGSRV
jgi:ABC-type multidrug transport system fused ATPase/permease subunit